ncbi:MAG: penicillin-binding protein 1C [Pseudomonadota bacterium]
MKRIGMLLLAGALFAAALLRDSLDAWIDATQLPALTAETSVEVLDRDGALLRAYTVADGRWRLKTDLDAVDPRYLAMLIAYEDKRFRTHAGVDPLAILRAFGQAMLNGRIVSGGSTLTMQVARLLEDSGTGALPGKLRQIRLALALERKLDKDQILTLYLNHAPFGGNLEGVRAATRAYFGKEPHRLTPAQAAVLVALPQSPETRRPDRYPNVARAARTRVLYRMMGSGAISQDQRRAAEREAIPDVRRPFPRLAAHLADRMRHADPGQGTHHLSLAAPLQAALERLVSVALRPHGNQLSAAVLVVDHRNGEVLASVGSGDYLDQRRRGFVDMTRALRSPGSTLKPLVYGLAFDDGLAHPQTLIDDRPTAFGSYRPQNFDGQYRGTLTVREALRLSLNIPVVRLTEAVGPARLIARMERAGMAPDVPGDVPGLAVALGGVGVTVEGMASLYAAMARGGEPIALRWTRTGAENTARARRLLSPEAAWHIGDILSGSAPPPGHADTGLAYKTGTSYGHRDAWAIGFDGRHTIVVWMGRADGASVPGAFGAELAAPLLFDAFRRLKPHLAPRDPPPPTALTTGTADLPVPLQRFRARNGLFVQARDAPRIAFPPEGAEVETGGVLVLKVEAGTPPFTWLADGHVLAVQSRERQEVIRDVAPGFTQLSVIDGKGRSARARVRLR